MTVAGVVGYDMDNLGDFSASPLKYFDFPGGSKIYTLYDYGSSLEEKWVIIGGGGLLGGLVGTHNRIEVLMRARRDGQRFVGWGLGMHRHGADRMSLPDQPPWYVNTLDLCGIRDDIPLQRWVPCASCMHPAFDTAPEPTNDLVIYSHKSIPIEMHLDGVPRKRSMTSVFGDMAAAVNFIASGAVVLTNSYHGAYWGTLLGRKVIVIDAWSTKFLYMKHRPRLATTADWQDHIDKATVYDGALEQCREANIRFHKKVLDLMAA